MKRLEDRRNRRMLTGAILITLSPFTAYAASAWLWRLLCPPDQVLFGEPRYSNYFWPCQEVQIGLALAGLFIPLTLGLIIYFWPTKKAASGATASRSTETKRSTRGTQR